MDLKEIQKVGLEAAFKGAEVLKSHLGKISHIRKKSAIDLVTEADTKSEQLIIETIKSHFPDHSILAEESGLNQGSSENLWIIDPLDGTTNYAHQLSLFAISIAYASSEELSVGIVLNPISGELFTALKGQGSMLNDQSVRVSETESAADSLLVTGFPYDIKENSEPIIKRLTNCLKASQGIRRLGSAALDLCFVACGRFDGFWEQNLKPWDTAAGLLIAREAGAMVTDFTNNPFDIEKNELLATNGIIHQDMISLLELN